MERKWTEDQKKVISTVDSNLLVSAAAGSGKTAVLVERIIQMITDVKNPTDIDRLIIMTFTRAAAAQMRQKIGDEIEKLITADPGSKQLRRQQKLLNNAVISTIDSFCIGIVHDYFHVPELDPAFRIADETEIELVRADCMAEMLEERYAKNDSLFCELRESYCTHKNDSRLEEIIFNMAQKALAAPWPQEWLDGITDAYGVGSVAEFDGTDTAKYVVEYSRLLLGTYRSKLERGIEICKMTDGPLPFLPMLEEALAVYDNIMAAGSYSELGSIITSSSFSVLSRKKSTDEDLREKAKNIRNSFKDAVNGIKKRFFYTDTASIIEIIKKSEPTVNYLKEMTSDYLQRFAAKKREMNIIDFNDAEHFALEILTVKTPEGRVRSDIAKELQKRYAEIIIDEYQDSNGIQEEIVNAIAGDSGERPYVFTVGDVKQSIYKFRNACPELFIKKQALYRDGLDNGTLINLDRNFRSREEVLSATNSVFMNVMHGYCGGIEYTEECSLKCGTDGQKAAAGGNGEDPYKTELILIRKKSGDEPAAESQTEMGTEEAGRSDDRQEQPEGGQQENSGDELTPEETDRVKTEARAVALRIRQLVGENGLRLWDTSDRNQGLRPAGYGDVVVLLRTIKGIAEVFLQVFAEEGIPAYSDVQSGFFKAEETALTMNYLKILDNPRDDIALVSILHSFIGNMDVDDLAQIKLAGDAACTSFYDAALAARGSEGAPVKKLEAFFEVYDRLSVLKNELGTRELICKIYDETGLYNYYSALPDGERRSGNLDMLLGYAGDYARTGFFGLFSFIRYIDKLKGRELDYGEAGNGAAANCVRIMSIHKSKGLEFPIVVLAGMGKKFNMRDFSGDVVVNSSYGIGIKYVDTENRIKYPGFYQGIIKAKGTEDVLGEEMRLLYVAMTRAKEKLIMTAFSDSPKTDIDYASILGAGSFIDFVYPTALVSDETIKLTELSAAEVFTAGVSEEAAKADRAEKAAEAVTGDGSAEKNGFTERLTEIRDREYPYASDAVLPVKLSVSDLKHQAIEEEEGENPFEETRGFMPGSEKTLPDFMRAPAEHGQAPALSGTGYGTLMHKCMQFIPMRLRTAAEVSLFLKEMLAAGKIDENEYAGINPNKIAAFLNTPLADRIRRADEKKQFFREKQFMLGMPAGKVDAEKYAGRSELIPVQGVIDAMFVEDGSIVILDYKTDSVEEGGEEQLADRYRMQLVCYAGAAEQLTGMAVSECLLYSFRLEKTIHVEV